MTHDNGGPQHTAPEEHGADPRIEPERAVDEAENRVLGRRAEDPGDDGDREQDAEQPGPGRADPVDDDSSTGINEESSG
ncbi:hypothetical protein ACLFMI_20025 [Pseudonocardia nantongensis]|uniref:hypothetical protein n=1 Tax=Pseudonocardia nantongensis TaxID=1181885 RepID=UPI00397DD432